MAIKLKKKVLQISFMVEKKMVEIGGDIFSTRVGETISFNHKFREPEKGFMWFWTLKYRKIAPRTGSVCNFPSFQCQT